MYDEGGGSTSCRVALAHATAGFLLAIALVAVRPLTFVYQKWISWARVWDDTRCYEVPEGSVDRIYRRDI